MMNQKQWDLLEEAFDEEEPWWEGLYADENDFKDLNLYDWLECTRIGPSIGMRLELTRHGYETFPVERDSFGWLIGGIRRKGDLSYKTICFG